MFLKSIELQGFKSFPDRTKLSFNDGITAVVGPNGSGKSNISDAVRWVLGEQSTKTLRGAKMEDVIFIGTQNRKSQGFAQVSLTIDNTAHILNVESEEVTVTRTYYRSGESEYRINGASVRLKDVNELFMDTGLGRDGYSMIGQGRIAEIVGAKSNERREIFEEAAGISKFRYRKTEAERKLKAAQENLLRLKDILSELEDRVGPLKEQSEKAEQFLILAERKKVLELSLWMRTLERSNDALREQGDKLMRCQSDYDAAEAAADELDRRVGEVYEQAQQCQIEIDELRRKRESIEAESAERTARIAVLENDIGHHQSNIERLDGEIATYETSDADLDAQAASKKEAAGAKREELHALERQIAQKQDELLHLNERSEQVSSQSAALNQTINRLILDQTRINMTVLSAENAIAELEQNLAALTAQTAETEVSYDSAQSELSEVADGLTAVAEKQDELQNAMKGYELKAASRRKKLAELEEQSREIDLAVREKQQKAKLLSDLESNLEGFAYSVKAVLKQAKNGALRGVLGTVSQLISVDEKYSVAVETALGASLQHVVVDSEGTAKNAIRLLKEQKAGRATFLPLTSVKGSELNEPKLAACEGFISLASGLVTVDAKYDGIVRSLLGRIAVVDDLDTAAVIAKQFGYKFRIVTLDGQVVNAGGSFTGGSQNKNHGILSRKNEIEKLGREAEKLLAQKRAQDGELDALRNEVASLDAQLTAMNSELLVVQEDKIRFEGEQKRLQNLCSDLDAQKNTLASQIKLAMQKQQSHKETIEQSNTKGAAVQSELAAKQEELSALSGSKDNVGESRAALSAALSELKLSMIACEKDIDSLEAQAVDILRRKENALQLAGELREKRQALAASITAIEGEIEGLRAHIGQAGDERTKIDQEIAAKAKERETLEGSITGIRTEQKQKLDEREKFSRELARLEERKISLQNEYDSIISRLWEEYNLTRSEAQRLAEPVENVINAQRDLSGVKSKIKALGTVNVAAIEEYKEVNERYEFLTAQCKDVEDSVSGLLRLIHDLTMQMQEIFIENFHKINEHFGRIFKELFGGGKAELTLTDEENVLDCGIEIYVQPPGKIIKNLAALSGGEQAFVAIAIYFAILKVRPAPFCILDEIEAALDDVNVVKYAEYLRSMSDKTQFIAITHRRGTMEEADVLYGVTMQEEGVSKLLELPVSEIEKQLKIAK